RWPSAKIADVPTVDLRPDQHRRPRAHRAADLINLRVGDGDAAIGPILAREFEPEVRQLARRGRLALNVIGAARIGAARRRARRDASRAHDRIPSPSPDRAPLMSAGDEKWHRSRRRRQAYLVKAGADRVRA